MSSESTSMWGLAGRKSGVAGAGDCAIAADAQQIAKARKSTAHRFKVLLFNACAPVFFICVFLF